MSKGSEKNQNDYECLDVSDTDNESNLDAFDEVIEDEPELIDLHKLLNHFLKHKVVLIILIIICGVSWGILHPGSSSVSYGARCRIYVPPYTSKEINGKRYVIRNSIDQLGNAIGLIQTMVYRDVIANELGSEALNGNFSVSRQKDTELITITAYAGDGKQSEELCKAVLDVFQNQIGKETSINDMIVVDPVTQFSNITATSTITSVFKGAVGGLGIYIVYICWKFFSDKAFHSKDEVEEYLGIPVLCVIPDLHSEKNKSR